MNYSNPKSVMKKRTEKSIWILLSSFVLLTGCQRVEEAPEVFRGILTFSIDPATRCSFGEYDRLGGELIWRSENWSETWNYPSSQLYLYSPSVNSGRPITMVYGEDGYFRSMDEVELSTGTKHFDLLNYSQLEYSEIDYPVIRNIDLQTSQDEQYFHWSYFGLMWLAGGVDVDVTPNSADVTLNNSAMSHAFSYVGFKLKTDGKYENRIISQIKIRTLTAGEYLTGYFNMNLQTGVPTFLTPQGEEEDSRRGVTIMNSGYRAGRDVTVNMDEPMMSHIGVVKPGTYHGLRFEIVFDNWGGPTISANVSKTFTFEVQEYVLFVINLDNMTVE